MIIDPEFQALICSLRREEKEQLEESIISDGCRDALIVWQGILVDGHNRYEICKRLNVPYQVKPIMFEDRLAAMIWIRRNQISRRNLTDDQRAMNAAALVELEVEKSNRERAKKAADTRWTPTQGCLVNTSVTKHPEPEAPQVSTSSPPPTERKRITVAKAAGVSSRKVQQAQEVKAASPERAEKVQAGEMSLAAATREIKREAIVAKLESIESKEAKAVEGVYDCIVIDPPWPMQKIERDERPNQSQFDYPTMTEAELEKLAIPSAPDCHVWLWTTHKFLPMAFRLLEKWGVSYIFCLTWHKPGGFQPINLPQYNSEFCLYARKGAPTFIDTKAFNTCFQAPRGAHSEKPGQFYELVKRVTAGRRLDMFSRRAIDGFDGWGLEAK